MHRQIYSIAAPIHFQLGTSPSRTSGLFQYPDLNDSKIQPPLHLPPLTRGLRISFSLREQYTYVYRTASSIQSRWVPSYFESTRHRPMTPAQPPDSIIFPGFIHSSVRNFDYLRLFCAFSISACPFLSRPFYVCKSALL